MKVSAKTEYACIAMLELASSYPSGEPLRIRTIADRHSIPARFLVQILLQLKGAGLVTSTRGASGGYQLARAPEDITLAEVVAVIEGPQDVESAFSSAPDSPAARVFQGVWRELYQAQRELLDSLTLADLIERSRNQTHEMYYI